MNKILLLVNPLFTSRGNALLRKTLGVFEQSEVAVEVVETGPNRGAGAQARHAVDRGMDAVLVWGGDGTVFDALQGLAGSTVPLGVFPRGTGNILAQNLKTPSRPISAARWLLAAKPHSVPLGKITCCSPSGSHTWYFMMAAGLGMHAAMMEEAQRHEKDKHGRFAYFVAGFKVLFSYPVRPFEIEITTVQGQLLRRRASELIAVRVAELNIWRPGGGLDFPFLRLASVESQSRWELAKASFQGLVLGAGRRDRSQNGYGAAQYEDILRVECRPIPGVRYGTSIAVEADGEILGASYATIEMADVCLSVLTSPSTLNGRA